MELLRTQASLQRHMIALNASELADSLNPKAALGNLLPGSSQGVVLRGLQFVTRYPYLLSSLWSGRRFKSVRWLSVVALIAGAWFAFSGSSATTTKDTDEEMDS